MNTSKSHLLVKRTRGNLTWHFHSILQVFERGFLQKISNFDTGPSKAGSGPRVDGRGSPSAQEVFRTTPLSLKPHPLTHGYYAALDRDALLHSIESNF